MAASPGAIDEHAEAVVIGAGLSGLAGAEGLERRGAGTTVLEHGEEMGATGRRHYRSLRLNSGRSFSALPGQGLPGRTAAAFGRERRRVRAGGGRAW